MHEEIIGALKKCGYPGDVHYCRDCVFANHGGTCRMKKLLPAAADAIETLYAAYTESFSIIVKAFRNNPKDSVLREYMMKNACCCEEEEGDT